MASSKKNSVRQRSTTPKQSNGSASPLVKKEDRKPDLKPSRTTSTPSQASLLTLITCVGGIYASFLTWGVLQERITTTNHGTPTDRQVFRFPVALNTMQSLFAALLGYLYVLATAPHLRIFPSRHLLFALGLVATTSALASPFGYAALAHVDYITFILAKSCKLLPVMFLHVVLYRRKYPVYKYAVVGLVTAGVAVFTLHGGKSKKASSSVEKSSSLYGLALLAVNLLFDGLTNATQDDIYARFRGYTGKQMMCALNVLQTALTLAYLLLLPALAGSGVASYLGLEAGAGNELADAWAFVQRYPGVGWDIVGFALCGALGQVFIFMTLEHFGSLLLVTVTVTRKMLTMIISVLWFGHRLTAMQWLGVGLVFGGVGIEAQLSRREKAAKERAKKVAFAEEVKKR